MVSVSRSIHAADISPVFYARARGIREEDGGARGAHRSRERIRRGSASPCDTQTLLSEFRSFEAWCAAHGLLAIPAAPATVAVYLAVLAGQGRRPSTIERALAGIGSAH